jgi:hypothetical protein
MNLRLILKLFYEYKNRYRKEMEVFKPSRDANKPKRPGTAFMLFMVDFRKEIAGKEPEGGVAALAKLGGERWRNMNEEEKKPYVEKQNECKQAYEAKMEEYRKISGNPTTNNSIKSIASVKSEDSEDNSEHLNNSLSNSNISNNNSVDQLNKLNNHDEQSHNQNHNSQSPVTSPHQNLSESPSITTTFTLQQPFYTTTNSFMSTNFLDQQHEASYSQTIDQQIDQQQLHDGQQNADQNDQAYLQNGGTYQHYGWN